MKWMHLSDLHIGKRVHEFSMMEDQKDILRKILEVIGREKVDGVIIAGDIYDKPVPSAEAVQVLDNFLTQLARRHIPVFAVSGNHDSAERVAFGAQFMSAGGVYLSPVYDGNVRKICLSDAYGQVWVYLLPFVKPATVRHAFEEEKIESYQDAVEAAIRHMEVDTDQRNLLVAHQFVTGASRCESEEISVGGLDNVDVSVFDAFDYVALGHIHSPQYIGRETVRYCGTPLKYSFSEAEQEKTVTIVEMGKKGEVSVKEIPLTPLHDMRKIRGTYENVMARSFYQEINREDYIQITLTDEEDVLDAQQRLRSVYPNLMRLEYDNRRTREQQRIDSAEAIEQKSELELFEEFYELQNNQPMSDRQRQFSRDLIQKILEKED
ncbi:MAG: exonuclease SbcCD subunit D [Lachnospiraceae bacterium]|nr:exonuclease SbcCD subunit D [Robinsoniella sp.]MDY3765097.1 exonuclease SbcCD subunit D [Lachnospiraceae bacterium]